MPNPPLSRTGVIVPVGSDPDQVPADLKRITDQYEARSAVFSSAAGAPANNTAGAVGEFRFDSTRNAAVWVGTGTGWTALPVMPVGGLLLWPGAGSPGDGVSWLPCDGSSLLRTDYPELYNAIGTVWGAQSPTTFSLPLFNGRSLVAAGAVGGLTTRSVGQTGGAETHTLTAAQIPDHVHGLGGVAGGGSGGGGAVVIDTDAPRNWGLSPDASGPVGPDGGGDQPHNNMPPYAVVRMLIRAR